MIGDIVKFGSVDGCLIQDCSVTMTIGAFNRVNVTLIIPQGVDFRKLFESPSVKKAMTAEISTMRAIKHSQL